MREDIPSKLEERPSPLAVAPTAAAAVVVEEQGEKSASWWFEHANSLVTAWRREQYPDHGTYGKSPGDERRAAELPGV